MFYFFMCPISFYNEPFSLTSPRKNRKNGLNPPCIEILVTDSVYVDVYAADEKMLFTLYDNAINQGFENIELDG